MGSAFLIRLTRRGTFLLVDDLRYYTPPILFYAPSAADSRRRFRIRFAGHYIAFIRAAAVSFSIGGWRPHRPGKHARWPLHHSADARVRRYGARAGYRRGISLYNFTRG